MRRLIKGPKPHILVVNEAIWTADYVAAVPRGEAKKYERWGHREVKVALNDETSGKCAYCEALMGDVTYPHVEHMIPKALRPELAHSWENLTWACPQCNVRKGDFYQEAEGLLNPYDDELADHLTFHGDFVEWVLGGTRGEITVRRLDLNRMDLVDSRRRRLAAVRELLNRWHTANGATRELLADAIRLDVAEGEFTGSVTAYVLHHGFPLAGPDGVGTEGAA